MAAMDNICIKDEKIKKTLKNLQSNNFEVYYAENGAEAAKRVLSLMKKGQSVAMGGSATLREIGIADAVSSGEYRFLDRHAPGLSPEDSKRVMREAFFADVYLTSANAVTESGNLYCVDGNGNRVSAMIFGPESVICVVGKNKIVSDIDAAVRRVKELAAPANTRRLACNTFCNAEGRCVSLKNSGGELCDGCGSDSRICCDYVVFSRQRIKNRIKVIVVNEQLGY